MLINRLFAKNTMNDTVYIMANNAAIDATILTKGDIVPAYARHHGIPLEKIAAMGDEVIDLPMLATEGLGLVGAPANAQEKVKDAVSKLPNGWISTATVLDAFLEFYSLARQRNISHIISDKDGVLLAKGDLSRGAEFASLMQTAGIEGNPYVMVLTGSSFGQNTKFLKGYGLDERLNANPAVRANPYLLLAENGLIHVDVLSGNALNFCRILNPALLAKLKTEFEPEVAGRMEAEIFPAFGFEWSCDADDQNEKVYHAPKEGMVTFNVPRYFKDGSDYRKSGQAKAYREAVVRIMSETAERIRMPYKIL